MQVFKAVAKRETECATPNKTRLLLWRRMRSSSARKSALVRSKFSLSLRNMMLICPACTDVSTAREKKKRCKT